MSEPEGSERPDASDPRPPVWVGHVALSTHDVAQTRTFMLKLGMRPIADGEGFAVLELRGGTHLVLLHTDDSSPKQAGFDLMVEDIDAAHRQFREAGLEPSEPEHGEIHTSFTVQSPTGHTIVFNSTHVSDLPV